MMTRTAIIDHVICGAAKSGTTCLADVLKTGRKVDFCIRKEPNFFCHENNSGNYHKGFDWYRNLFADNGLPKCEASTRYMYADESPGLIYAANPEAKIVFILRDPVDRVYSDYWENVKRGRGHEDFFTALQSNRLDSLIDGSRYGRHLKKYYKIFPSDRILVVFYEQMQNQKMQLFEKLFDFLKIDPDQAARRQITALKGSNTSAVPRSPLLSRLYHNYRLRHYLEFLPYPLNRRLLSLGAEIRPLILKKKKYPAMSDETRRILLDYLIDDIKETGRLLNVDLSAWMHSRVRKNSG